MIYEIQERLWRSKEHYNNNFDKKIHKNVKNIKRGDNLFFSADWRDQKETRHKLAQITEGPFPVTKIGGEAKTVIIARPDTV